MVLNLFKYEETFNTATKNYTFVISKSCI